MTIPPGSLLGAEHESDLDSIEDVIFIGYPNGLYDRTNLLPIARRGTTASPIGVDHEGLPAFLVDASVFPGSSGSPVFLIDRGLRMLRSGAIQLGGHGARRVLCLGVLVAVHTRSIEGKVTEIPARVAVTFDEPIGLGVVYKASTFAVCVDHFLESNGLKRAA